MFHVKQYPSEVFLLHAVDFCHQWSVVQYYGCRWVRLWVDRQSFTPVECLGGRGRRPSWTNCSTTTSSGGQSHILCVILTHYPYLPLHDRPQSDPFSQFSIIYMGEGQPTVLNFAVSILYLVSLLQLPYFATPRPCLISVSLFLSRLISLSMGRLYISLFMGRLSHCSWDYCCSITATRRRSMQSSRESSVAALEERDSWNTRNTTRTETHILNNIHDLPYLVSTIYSHREPLKDLVKKGRDSYNIRDETHIHSNHLIYT